MAKNRKFNHPRADKLEKVPRRFLKPKRKR